MGRLRFLAALWVATLACRDEPKTPPRPAPAPPAFTLRDLALATALDAALARLTLVAFDVHPLVLEAGASASGRARPLIPPLRAAKAEMEQAASAVSHPADRVLASRVATLAGRYAEALAAAAEASAPSAAEHGALGGAQRGVGEAIDAYRRSRAGWRLRAPEPQGAEREFDEARRALERSEGAPQRSAPAAVEREVERAVAAARRLAPPLRAPAARYTSAQARALAGLQALSRAADARSAAVAGRAYMSAKADALGALADYFAALATR